MPTLAGAAVLAGVAIAAGPLGPTRQEGSAPTRGALTETTAPGSGSATTSPVTTTAGSVATTGPAQPADAMSASAIVDDAVPAGTAPGTLLGSVALPAAPGGARRWRIAYASVGARGEVIAETALVAEPSGTPPPGGWPLLSIGHPTVGSADICAPSLPGSLFGEAIELFTGFGYLTVVSDLEGLGTSGPAPFLDGGSAGRAVLDAARAARRLDVPTSAELTAWGVSEGGQAVLFAAEQAAAYAPELSLRATVALAPVSGGEELFERVAGGPQRGFVLLAVAGVAVARDLDPADVLTPAGLGLLPAVAEVCSDDLQRRVAAVDGPLFEPAALTRDPWAAAIRADEPGGAPVASPVLIVHGTADDLIPEANSAALAERYRSSGSAVDYLAVPGAGHVDVAISSLDAVVTWLAAHR